MWLLRQRRTRERHRRSTSPLPIRTLPTRSHSSPAFRRAERAGVSSAAQPPSTTSRGQERSSAPSHGPANPTVEVRVQDNSNAQSNTASQTVTVNNVAPTVVLAGHASANEGDTKSYTYTISDPGQDTHLTSPAAPTAPAPTRQRPTTSSARSRMGRRVRPCR